jgi:hypothetical protein
MTYFHNISSIYVNSSHVLVDFRYEDFRCMPIRELQELLVSDSASGSFNWEVCTGASCPKHQELRSKALELYWEGKDSEETSREMDQTWQEAVPPPLNPVLASAIEEAEGLGQPACNPEPARETLCPFPPSRKKQRLYKEDGEKDDKARKTLAQVSPFSLSLLCTIF